MKELIQQRINKCLNAKKFDHNSGNYADCLRMEGAIVELQLFLVEISYNPVTDKPNKRELLEALKTAIKILQAAKCTAAVLNPLEDILAKAEGKK